MKRKTVRGVMSMAVAAVMTMGLAGCGASGGSAMGQPAEAVECEAVEGLPEDFIFGADVSAYASEIDSGVTYYDFNGNALDEAGFFTLLADGGVNYIRLRLWNDPYDEDGNTYGGGNCDIETVTRIGKLATDAGMRVLVDFHYSDFWADPGKQTAPKAWKRMSADDKAEALADFTRESLTTLYGAGVDVGMVQIGNETTTGFCGEVSWSNISKLMNAGSGAAREVAAANDRDILVAVHFTNPETKGRYAEAADRLYRYDVDYDVFASSWYPYWHGSLDNLTEQLLMIADTYDKKVMVTETSYIHTLADGDGTGNTEGEIKYTDTFDYDISAQGQVDMLRDLTAALVGVGDSAIGVCWWEPAWIPVQVYDPDAENADEVLAQNQKIWEEQGSGWATSFAGGYDKDASEYYGGSAVDNEAWFDFTGHPLASVNACRYIREGSSLPNGASRMASEEKPAKPEGLTDSSLPGGAQNLLANPGFEEKSDWEIENVKGAACAIEDDTSNVLNGDYCLKFWDDEDFEFYARQEVTLDAGTYTLGGHFEGGDCGTDAVIEICLQEGDAIYSADTEASGWQDWHTPEVTDITIASDGTPVTVYVYVKAKSGGWGAWDDLYLYRAE